MAYGLAATGLRFAPAAATAQYRTIQEYRDQIRAVVAQGLVDIVL